SRKAERPTHGLAFSCAREAEVSGRLDLRLRLLAARYLLLCRRLRSLGGLLCALGALGGRAGLIEERRGGEALEARLEAVILGALLELEDGSDELGAGAELVLHGAQHFVEVKQLLVGDLGKALRLAHTVDPQLLGCERLNGGDQ